MLTWAEIDKRLEECLLLGGNVREREALETAQKLGNLLADLRAHCIDCEVDCNGPRGYEERVCPMAIAEREADVWLRGETQ